MGAGHSHVHDDLNQVTVGSKARTILIAFLSVLGVLTIAGMIWLWPSKADLDANVHRISDAPGFSFELAKITAVREGCDTAQISNAVCLTATVELKSGPETGTTVDVPLQGPQAQAGLRTGDEIKVGRVTTAEGPVYSYSDANRIPFMMVLGVLFLIVVAAVARWKGLFALLGLVFAGVVLIGFMLPALLAGKPGIIVALVGGTAIMFVVLYVAHGVSMRTSAALVGTLLGVGVTTALGAISVEFARLSGFAEESDFELSSLASGINFKEILMVAIIIGGLGVLNDVTITQSSAVWELRAAAPSMTRRELFTSGMRIGRDHIASTIYTIVFAYAGGALTVLLLVFFTTRTTLDLLNVEQFSGEIVRTLGSSIGLILSVPITTGIAALTVAGPVDKPENESHVSAELAPRHHV